MLRRLLKPKFLLFPACLLVGTLAGLCQDDSLQEGYFLHREHTISRLGKKTETPSFLKEGLLARALSPASPLASRSLLPEHKVFGWYLDWMGDTADPGYFNLLSHVAYFSYELDPHTGGARNMHNWLSSPALDTVKAINPGCNILLTVSCFGNDTRIFLGKKKAQTRLIQTLLVLLDRRKAQGVNLDFEGIPDGYADAFAEFVKELSAACKPKGLLVTVAIPAVDYHHIFTPSSLNDYVDLYVLMAYGYYGSFSSKPGPMSPLNASNAWGAASISSSVQAYLDLQMPPAKLLVALPYYGAFWSVGKNGKPEFENYSSYSSYMQKIDAPLSLDSISSGAFHVHVSPHQRLHFWGEDSTSLSLKMDWIKQNQLGGVGIWALGYDSGHETLWNLLAAKFADTSGTDQRDSSAAAANVPGGKGDATIVQKAGNFVKSYPYTLLFTALWALVFAFVGFVMLPSSLAIRNLSDEKRKSVPFFAVCFLAAALLASVLVYGFSELSQALSLAFGTAICIFLLLIILMLKNIFTPRELP